LKLDASVRTTVTIDEDLAVEIRRLMRERGTGFKETLNDLLRRGLRAGERPEPFETPTFDLGA
jgi:hypothetical protein